MNYLPDVPFEKMLSYLSLKDLLRARAVSKEFNRKINNYRVRSLCYSDWEKGYIIEKNRLVSGAFAQNFISTHNFDSFFNAYGRSVLSGLKHLRVCSLEMVDTSAFFKLLNSFDKLESLHLNSVENLDGDFKLILPKLRSICIERCEISGDMKLSLDAPRLAEIRCWSSIVCLNIVHPLSVETAFITTIRDLPALESLKNLKYLYWFNVDKISDTLLASLEQLREIHFEIDYDPSGALVQLHNQKQNHGRNDLKIYYCGLCLASPRDYPRDHDFDSPEFLTCTIANYASLADPLRISGIEYSTIEAGPPLPVDFWTRLIELEDFYISERVVNVEQFLNVLRKCPSVRSLSFGQPQPQDLFDQLPAYCSNIEHLSLTRQDPNVDLSFLFKLDNLTSINVEPIDDVHLIPKLFKELKFVRCLSFKWRFVRGHIEIDRFKRIYLDIYENEEEPQQLSDVDEAVQIIIECQNDGV